MKKLVALFVVVLMATPAFAAVQNVKVSGDINSTYISRNHFNLGTKGGDGVETLLSKQNVFTTQTRLRVDADLSDNVSTTVALLNERAWGVENDALGNAAANDTDVNINLVYVTLREMLYSPLTVTIGRQIFAYGNGLIIGDGGPNNATGHHFGTVAADLTLRTTYDGIKAVLDYKPLTLDLVYFKNDADLLTGAIDQNDDSDVYGINANYQLGDSMNTVVEGYFFSRVNGDKNGGTVTNTGDSVYVPGLRVSTNPIKGLNTQAEIVWQRGIKATTTGNDNIRREALAAQFMASYELPVLEQYKPLASASYTHVSGDKNSGIGAGNAWGQASSEKYTAWDPLFESQNGGTIYNALYNLSNMNIVTVGIQANPIEDVTAKFTWSGLWAAAKYSAQNTLTLNQPDRALGAGRTATTVVDERALGNEYDVNLTYAYTEDVTFGLNMGWYVPGNALAGGNDSTASQALANVAVAF